MKKNIFQKIKANVSSFDIKKFLKKHYVVFFKEAPLLLFFVLTALFNTILLRFITVGNLFYFKPLFADLGMIFILSSFMFLFKKDKSRKKYLVFLSIVISLVCVINSVYYTYYDSFVSISLLATATFVVEVGDAVVDKVLRVTDLLYLWQPLFVYYYYIKENNMYKDCI